MSQLLVSPETKKILADVHTFSTVSERLATVAEQLPDKVMKDVSKLQKQMVNQVMKEFDKWSEKNLNDVWIASSASRRMHSRQY
jgi:predicted ATPase